MNIYIDFEANGVSQVHEIISIGAVTETGETFYSLVKSHFKLDNRIKQLTHISQEDMDNAPSLEEVMQNFSAWLSKVDNGEAHTFIVYGTNDRGFVGCSRDLTENEAAKNALTDIYDNMVRVDSEVGKKLTGGIVGLQSAYLTMRGETTESEQQKHNALEDAEMLRYVWQHIDDFELREGQTLVRVPRAFSRSKKEHTHSEEGIYARKYEFSVKGMKGARKPIIFKNLRAALPVFRKRFKSNEEKEQALETLLSLVESGDSLNGWTLTRV